MDLMGNGISGHRVRPLSHLRGAMSPSSVAQIVSVRYSSGRGRKSKDDLNRSRLSLFRQGGATVGLRTRLSEERDQGGSIFIGRFVEVIREMFIRRDVFGIL